MLLKIYMIFPDLKLVYTQIYEIGGINNSIQYCF
jgi:hypothetical protein